MYLSEELEAINRWQKQLLARYRQQKVRAAPEQVPQILEKLQCVQDIYNRFTSIPGLSSIDFDTMESWLPAAMASGIKVGPLNNDTLIDYSIPPPDLATQAYIAQAQSEYRQGLQETSRHAQEALQLQRVEDGGKSAEPKEEEEADGDSKAILSNESYSEDDNNEDKGEEGDDKSYSEDDDNEDKGEEGHNKEDSENREEDGEGEEGDDKEEEEDREEDGEEEDKKEEDEEEEGARPRKRRQVRRASTPDTSEPSSYVDKPKFEESHPQYY